MKLYLVQHAEAKSEQEDPERALAEAGRASIRKMADFIAKRTDVRVDRIVHSGKTRARQTAEVLAEYLEPLNGITEGEELAPLDDISTWVNRLADMDEDMVIVGHMPYLGKLSSFLLIQDMDKPIINFKNSGVVCLERELSGIWSLHWMLIPRILKD